MKETKKKSSGQENPFALIGCVCCCMRGMSLLAAPPRACTMPLFEKLSERASENETQQAQPRSRRRRPPCVSQTRPFWVERAIEASSVTCSQSLSDGRFELFFGFVFGESACE